MFEESRDFLFVISLYVWDAAVPFTGSTPRPNGWCKQGMFPLLLCCSLQSRCGLRPLGVCLSPCCSIRSHLWLPFAERLLKACENLVALKVGLEHVVSSADARQHGPPSVAVSS